MIKAFIEKFNLSGYLILITVWIFIQLLSFYVFDFFIIPFIWLITIFVLLIIIIKNLIYTIKNRNVALLLYQGLLKLNITIILFGSTFYGLSYVPQLIIEKLDWVVLYNQRKNIIDEVKSSKLQPNVSYNDFMCELPYEFPVVSNGGNDIAIYHSDENEYTIVFFVFRNFFEAPSTKIIYSENLDNIKYFEEKIKRNPGDNWKIRDNWYRVYGD